MHAKLHIGIMNGSRKVQEVALIVIILLFIVCKRVVVFGSRKDSVGAFTLNEDVRTQVMIFASCQTHCDTV